MPAACEDSKLPGKSYMTRSIHNVATQAARKVTARLRKSTPSAPKDRQQEQDLETVAESGHWVDTLFIWARLSPWERGSTSCHCQTQDGESPRGGIHRPSMSQTPARSTLLERLVRHTSRSAVGALVEQAIAHDTLNWPDARRRPNFTSFGDRDLTEVAVHV